MPNTSNKIPIGAITNAILAYVIPALHAVVRLPSVNDVQSITFVCIASYSIMAMKKNRIDTTIPMIPIPIGISQSKEFAYLNKNVIRAFMLLG